MQRQIKIEQQDENQAKVRPSLKAAIRLAQKQQQQIISHLELFHNQQLVQPFQYQQEKTQLQKHLDTPSSQRTKKHMKNIKAELTYLPCFQIQAQGEMPKQVLAIMKRDIDMFTAVISKFVYPTIYTKGSIIEEVATQRQSIKILLRGEVAVYEPINYKSYKNCLKNKKADNIATEWLGLIAQTFLGANSQNIGTDKNSHNHNTNPQLVAGLLSSLKQDEKLTDQICKKILTQSNIITPTTPHRLTRLIGQGGQLVANSRQCFIIKQSKNIEFNAICLTEVYLMELQYNVYKNAISLLNSDEEKNHIRILLRKFEMLEYFDAKQYVKKQYMINKKREQEQVRKRLLKEQERNKEAGTQFLLTRQNEPTQKIVRQIDTQSERSSAKSKSNQSEEQLDLQTYQIKYDSDIYLIISGEVTIIIDRVEEIRLSSLEHASKIRKYKSHQVLQLYSSDIFGFEEIGKVRQYNLRYRVNKNSKLLLLSQNVYVKHFTQIPGFRHAFKSIQNERNKLIETIVKGIEKTIDNQQVKHYQSISSLQLTQRVNASPRSSNDNSPNLIKKVQFFGNKKFELVESIIKNRLIKDKQGEISKLKFKDVIKSGAQLKDSLAFASIYKDHLPKQCQIVGNYIEIRNSKGILQRKKCIVDNNKEKGIFRKLGIISDEDRNDHNLALVANRRSKYQLQDFYKQKKQIERLRSISQSLPKLNFFYAKKPEILYNNIHKRDF